MRAHSSTLTARILRAALRSPCRYRICAVGYDYRNRIIGITTNSYCLVNNRTHRGMHAEELLLARSPRSLRRISIARIGHDGKWLPIEPCDHCMKLARHRGVTIARYEP